MFGNKQQNPGFTVQPIQSQESQVSAWQIVLVIFAGLWMLSAFAGEGKDGAAACDGITFDGQCAPVPSLPPETQ